jgi:hypothetical protein
MMATTDIIFALGTSAYVNSSGSFFATSLLAISTLPLSTLMQRRAVSAKQAHPARSATGKAEDASCYE